MSSCAEPSKHADNHRLCIVLPAAIYHISGLRTLLPIPPQEGIDPIERIPRGLCESWPDLEDVRGMIEFNLGNHARLRANARHLLDVLSAELIGAGVHQDGGEESDQLTFSIHGRDQWISCRSDLAFAA
eukprot:CAMPEP_0115403614 /NCGR_PEP_ID=MMETSP0271-20121206/16992_1 /TAXON_ID=71861 /ORGANISM="Scrippsiella trochoidea, Strain CCMP3099" /LENGTH=128 /DNA_ID=CAMNT_0002827561 /DNA_START=177 /DNA_END=563 /DNA_ORIENTATION=+